MSKKVLIGGIGNVLLGDDAVGPYVIRLLESEYTFPDNVQIADLGTPALDLTHRIAGLYALIVVDCVASDDHPPGTVLLYGKSDILRVQPVQRLDPHSPALSECLMTADMLGASPEHILLVGVVGQAFDPGEKLTSAVHAAAGSVIHAILAELQRLEVPYDTRKSVRAAPLWWCEEIQNSSTENGRLES